MSLPLYLDHHVRAAVAQGRRRRGIDVRTAAVAARSGARCFVSGSAVFHSPEPADSVRRIRAAAGAAISGER